MRLLAVQGYDYLKKHEYHNENWDGEHYEGNDQETWTEGNAAYNHEKENFKSVMKNFT